MARCPALTALRHRSQGHILQLQLASLGNNPGLFAIVGTDIFEFEFEQRKYKFILWRDRASGLVMVEELQSYGGPEDVVFVADGAFSWQLGVFLLGIWGQPDQPKPSTQPWKSNVPWTTSLVIN